MNAKLKSKLKKAFSPLGIVAYSGCCCWGCTGSYDEDDGFKPRDNGIYYIKMFLDGMNYEEVVTDCFAQYWTNNGDDDIDGQYQYLMEHWDEEVQILVKFCDILGLKEGEYTISRPKNGRCSICIHFEKPYRLERVGKVQKWFRKK